MFALADLEARIAGALEGLAARILGRDLVRLARGFDQAAVCGGNWRLAVGEPVDPAHDRGQHDQRDHAQRDQAAIVGAFVVLIDIVGAFEPGQAILRTQIKRVGGGVRARTRCRPCGCRPELAPLAHVLPAVLTRECPVHHCLKAPERPRHPAGPARYG
jgi:hypothetical protein